MESLIHELRSRYADRYVILDSTPLLSTTEPEVLAKLVDGIVVVVEGRRDPKGDSETGYCPPGKGENSRVCAQ